MNDTTTTDTAPAAGVAQPAPAGQAVATQEQQQGSTAVAVADYGQYAGAGFEGTTAADFKPSFLRVLQGQSPQIETVKGAKPGLWVDSVTNDLYEAITVVPAVRQHVIVAWKPRGKDSQGGADGFGGVFELTDPMVVAASKLVKKFERGDDGKIKHPKTPDGVYDLIETIYFHCAQLLKNGAIVPVTIPFASTSLGVADNWFSTMRRLIIPNTSKMYPLFAHASTLGTAKKEGGGYKWYVPTYAWANSSADESRLSPDSDLFKAGLAIYEAFKAGNVDVDYAATGAQTGEGAVKADADVPF